MQIYQREIKTCYFIRKTKKVTISKIIRIKGNEKEQKKKSRREKSLKS